MQQLLISRTIVAQLWQWAESSASATGSLERAACGPSSQNARKRAFPGLFFTIRRPTHHMDKNAPAVPQDASHHLAKQISLGNDEGAGSIFSQLTSNPFFTAVSRLGFTHALAPMSLIISCV